MFKVPGDVTAVVQVASVAHSLFCPPNPRQRVAGPGCRPPRAGQWLSLSVLDLVETAQRTAAGQCSAWSDGPKKGEHSSECSLCSGTALVTVKHGYDAATHGLSRRLDPTCQENEDCPSTLPAITTLLMEKMSSDELNSLPKTTWQLSGSDPGNQPSASRFSTRHRTHTF